MTNSNIKIHGGVPTLFVNGTAQPGLAYITYLPERNCYADFTTAGYRLFSVTAYFGDQGINAVTGILPFSQGIFARIRQADYSSFDTVINQILSTCPDALIIPRVNMALPSWWELEHPEECNDEGTRGSHPRSCFSSSKWRQDTEVLLREFIAHVENSPFREHIIGYQLAGGNTEEWFSFDGKGSQGSVSRKRFSEFYPKETSEFTYRQFLSNIVAESIVYFAAVVKECIARRLIVGSFYGYTLECPFWQSGHHALQLLLKCPDIDFLCAPSSYMNQRQPGYDWACMTVLDSLTLHGKMFFSEYDTRTYLTRPLAECRVVACEPGTYHDGVWQGPKSPEVSRWLLRANFARQLTHGTGSWWFDMWGGWFADQEIMHEMAEFLVIAKDALLISAKRSVAEVAVVVDESSYAYITDNAISRRCCYENRRPLGLTGTPYDIYDVADFAAIRLRYSAFIFLCPFLTPGMAMAMDDCREHCRSFLVADRQHPDLSIEKLRNFYRQEKLHCWCDTNDVIYVSSHYLAIHATTAGQKCLHLDATYKVTSLLDPDVSFTGDCITMTLKDYETKLFKLQAIEKKQK